jgi:hypothetical protein
MIIVVLYVVRRRQFLVKGLCSLVGTVEKGRVIRLLNGI